MERVSFFRWEQSSTNKFLSMELVQHANYQKAALVLEELTRMSQDYFNRVWEKCGTRLVHELRTADIMRLPRDAEQARKYFGFT